MPPNRSAFREPISHSSFTDTVSRKASPIAIRSSPEEKHEKPGLTAIHLTPIAMIIATITIVKLTPAFFDLAFIIGSAAIGLILNR